MASRDNSAAAAANINHTPASAAAVAAGAPPQAAAQGPPLAPPFPGWPSSSQAFYLHGGGASFYPNPSAPAYSWLGQAGDPNPFYLQHMMGPYPSPIPYPPVYPPGAAFPPHPAVTAGQLYIAGVEAGRRAAETKKNLEVFREQIRDEEASNSYSESKGSSESTNTPSKKTSSESFGDGDSSQHVVAMQYASTATESSFSGGKLSIQAPGRAALKNSGIESKVSEASTWHASDTGGIPSAVNFVPTSAAHAMAGQEENMSGHPWMKDDQELKKERRKQSNRESARRSRIKKQECEELAKRVRELNNENGALTGELDQLNKSCEGLETENSSLQRELITRYGPDVLSVLL